MLNEGLDFVAETPHGRKRGYSKNGEFCIYPTTSNDGSLLQPTREAKRSIANILTKSGHDSPLVKEALRAYESAPPGRKVQIAPNLEVIKWSITKILPDLNKPLMNALVPMKIAFEFLACHLGTAVYGAEPELTEIRCALQRLDGKSPCCRVERMYADNEKVFHGICFEGNHPHASVQIRLFGCIAFRVHFPSLAVGGPRFAYKLDLETDKEYISEVTLDIPGLDSPRSVPGA